MQKIKNTGGINRFEFYLTALASICSITSIVLLIFTDYTKSIIALVAFIIFLIAVFIRIHFALKAYILNKYPRENVGLSTYIRYSTNDCRYYKYEVFKHLQNKTPICNEFKYEFKWSGNTVPAITSKIQDVRNGIVKQDNTNYDYIILKLKNPLLYNDIFVIHAEMDLDDSANLSSPHLETKVEYPVHMIHQVVELGYKPNDYAKKAILKKKKIGCPLNVGYETCELIDFDIHSKSYTNVLIDPEPGYFYRLEWEK